MSAEAPRQDVQLLGVREVIKLPVSVFVALDPLKVNSDWHLSENVMYLGCDVVISMVAFGSTKGVVAYFNADQLSHARVTAQANDRMR